MRQNRWLLWTLLFAHIGGSAQTRHAFVVGNDSYPGNELKNARSDASAVYESLKGVGYAATLVLDASRPVLIDKLDHFVESLRPGDVALLYYAGHGLQVNGENFLVPVDFKMTTPDSVADEGYSLSTVLERFTSHGATTQIVILDSCRDNPFLGNRSVKGGWAPLGTSAGSFLAFGTSPGSTASDDPQGEHGLFTKDLLPLLTKSNLDIEQMFRLVREAVIRDSHGQQIPWIASSLIGSYHIRPSLDLGEPQVSPAPVLVSDSQSTPGRSLGSGDEQTSNSLVNQESTDVESQIQQAAGLARSAHFNEAIEILQHVLAAVPTSSVALHTFALVLHAAGRDEEAVGILDRSLNLNSQDGVAALYKCAVEGISGSATAERDCDWIVQLFPSAETYLAQAATLEIDGNDERANSAALQSLAIHPTDLGFALKGQIASKRGQVGIAARDYARAAGLASPPTASSQK